MRCADLREGGSSVGLRGACKWAYVIQKNWWPAKLSGQIQIYYKIIISMIRELYLKRQRLCPCLYHNPPRGQEGSKESG